jgi:hypothetical protein
MSHMSVLGACWVQAYFEERPIFGRKDLILEKNNWQESSMQKMRKSNMQEGKATCEEAGKPNHIRVRVFDKYCNGYKLVK